MILSNRMHCGGKTTSDPTVENKRGIPRVCHVRAQVLQSVWQMCLKNRYQRTLNSQIWVDLILLVFYVMLSIQKLIHVDTKHIFIVPKECRLGMTRAVEVLILLEHV